MTLTKQQRQARSAAALIRQREEAAASLERADELRRSLLNDIQAAATLDDLKLAVGTFLENFT